MLWLIGFVLMLQSISFWVLKPLTLGATGGFSLHWFPWLLLLAVLWLFAGRMD